jgi:chromosome segregation ATPase
MTYTEAEAVVKEAMGGIYRSESEREGLREALAALDEMRREYEASREQYRLAHADWADTERRLAEADREYKNAEKRCETLTEHLAAANDLWEDDRSRLDETREMLNDQAARLAEAERWGSDLEAQRDEWAAKCLEAERVLRSIAGYDDPNVEGREVEAARAILASRDQEAQA